MPAFSLSALEGVLLPLLQPLLLEFWNQVAYPELQKLEGQIGSADLKLVVDTFEKALNSIVQVEEPKI
jgi:hypothetical protein